jgi:hypothetical protein
MSRIWLGRCGGGPPSRASPDRGLPSPARRWFGFFGALTLGVMLCGCYSQVTLIERRASTAPAQEDFACVQVVTALEAYGVDIRTGRVRGRADAPWRWCEGTRGAAPGAG